jgi:hypothetical protein
MNKVPEHIIIKKITPTFTTVVTTMEKYSKDQKDPSGLIIDPSKSAGTLMEYQKVIAIGSSVRNCQVGDLVKIDPSRYARYAQRKSPNVAEEVEGYTKQLVGYCFRTVDIKGEKCLMVQDADIEFVIEDYDIIKIPVIYTEANTSSTLNN